MMSPTRRVRRYEFSAAFAGKRRLGSRSGTLVPTAVRPKGCQKRRMTTWTRAPGADPAIFNRTVSSMSSARSKCGGTSCGRHSKRAAPSTTAKRPSLVSLPSARRIRCVLVPSACQRRSLQSRPAVSPENFSVPPGNGVTKCERSRTTDGGSNRTSSSANTVK